MADVPPPGRPDEGLVAGGAQYPAGPPERWPAWVPPLAPPASAPDPAPGGGSSERRTAGLVAAAAVAVLVLVVGAVAWATGGGDDDETATEATTSSSSTSTAPSLPPTADPGTPTLPSIPGLDPSDPGSSPLDDARPLDEVLPGLIDFVERERGLRFRTEPVVTALSEDAFLERYRELGAGSEDELREGGVALRALGILEPDDDPVAIQDAVGEQGVLGFYDPATAELAVRGESITPFVEIIIVHELTHALDDQHFDLGRAEVLAERSDESGFAFLALVEGSARVVQVAYEEQMSLDEQLSAQLESLTMGLGGQTGPGSEPLPVPFAVATQLPYGNGAELVRSIVAGGGTAALDAAFRDPPTTSEQVLDPTAYATRDEPVAVASPFADGTVVDEGAFGAVDLRVLEVVADPAAVASLLDQSAPVSPALAVDPVEGFGGGSYVAWEDGDRACIRFTVVGETPSGSATIEAVLDQWSQTVDGATLAPTDGGTGGATATRCA